MDATDNQTLRTKCAERTECAVCGADMNLGDDVVENELFECADCGTEYEVTSTDPLRVELAPEVEEDWGE